jgi:hypothetical protein
MPLSRAFLALLALTPFPLAGCGRGDTPDGGHSPAALAKHKFWEVKVTPEQIESFVEKARSLPKGGMIAADEKFQVFHQEPSAAFMTRHAMKAKGRGRTVVIDLADYESRPSREKVLGDLAAELDRAEFAAKD